MNVLVPFYDFLHHFDSSAGSKQRVFRSRVCTSLMLLISLWMSWDESSPFEVHFIEDNSYFCKGSGIDQFFRYFSLGQVPELSSNENSFPLQIFCNSSPIVAQPPFIWRVNLPSHQRCCIQSQHWFDWPFLPMFRPWWHLNVVIGFCEEAWWRKSEPHVMIHGPCCPIDQSTLDSPDYWTDPVLMSSGSPTTSLEWRRWDVESHHRSTKWAACQSQ